MADLLNNFSASGDSVPTAGLGVDYNAPFLALLAKAEVFYQAKLLALNPNDYSSNELFMRKWYAYKAQLDTINDLQQLLKEY